MGATDKTLIIAVSIVGVYLIYKASQGVSSLANTLSPSSLLNTVTALPGDLVSAVNTNIVTPVTDTLSNVGLNISNALSPVGLSISNALSPAPTAAGTTPTVGTATGNFFGLSPSTLTSW